jgi:hypothetical protein
LLEGRERPARRVLDGPGHLDRRLARAEPGEYRFARLPGSS